MLIFFNSYYIFASCNEYLYIAAIKLRICTVLQIVQARTHTHTHTLQIEPQKNYLGVKIPRAMRPSTFNRACMPALIAHLFAQSFPSHLFLSNLFGYTSTFAYISVFRPQRCTTLTHIFHVSASNVDHFAALRQPAKIPLLTGTRGIRPLRCHSPRVRG